MEDLLDLLPWFPNARALIVHRGQHNGPMPLLRDHPDVAAAALRFLREGGMMGLPSRVSRRRRSASCCPRPAAEPARDQRGMRASHALPAPGAAALHPIRAASRR